jgi:hypothetical protein
VKLVVLCNKEGDAMAFIEVSREIAEVRMDNQERRCKVLVIHKRSLCDFFRGLHAYTVVDGALPEDAQVIDCMVDGDDVHLYIESKKFPLAFKPFPELERPLAITLKVEG